MMAFFSAATLTNRELINACATAFPGPVQQPKMDMSKWSDQATVKALFGPYSDSAMDELVKRANATAMTVADYIGVRD